MVKPIFTYLFFFLLAFNGLSEKLDSLLEVRGFCIAAPRPDRLSEFVTFIDKELAPRKVNTLILRVDFNYQFQSHPELRDSIALSQNDVKKIVAVCKKHKINLIPQINLLGHQSWAGTVHNLLRVYPQFDETPHVKMPVKYEWPNEDGLYCKSYCPLHPDVHKVVFALVDEICQAFESNAFHAGMDEVFYLGDEKCPRCGGRDKAELFAGEVRKISEHLARADRRLWIWGDRLIEGKETGLGMWEASFNNTHRAIDMVPKNVMICDWHYERPDKTPVYFAMKGFDVVTCPWRKPEVAVAQLNDMVNYRKESTPEMGSHMKGMLQTVWSDAGEFLDGYYGKKKDEERGGETDWNCFKRLFDEIGKLE
ncbi:MAG TPA: family 20 glycosylhydrolase [Cytophagales bacterium]|nr:family 20 glycosylhydrolase [Cytophagales bacterium]